MTMGQAAGAIAFHNFLPVQICDGSRILKSVSVQPMSEFKYGTFILALFEGLITMPENMVPSVNEKPWGQQPLLQGPCPAIDGFSAELPPNFPRYTNPESGIFSVLRKNLFCSGLLSFCSCVQGS